ncbi:cytochrome b [Falsirhodobacter halotolerans]|uniref:cytochrome b n=1 Tax=Falsirhodobacter halotolerans TaxID=1146892 RepID=UPI001FD62316|nr:cytochrome b/b6 domain-containing protein [Falsirhodobacter halotolerans]MCJ8140263.1 cytochrome b/b6 domain-containing protein [Falsirhodobacter halotolerans]
MRRYPIFSRILHWALAALVFWQIGIVTAYKIAGSSPFLDKMASLGPSHGMVGLIVLPLALLRLVRPPAASNRAARLVHHTLRVLLVAIPALALLRAYGSGKGWVHRGLTIVPETGEEVAWMVKLGNIAHGELAWVMIALIGLHIAGAVMHGFRRDVTLHRRA